MTLRRVTDRANGFGFANVARATVALSLIATSSMTTVRAAAEPAGLASGSAASKTPSATTSATPVRNSQDDAQRRAQAKAKYLQGVEAYRAGSYADAVRQFLEADAIEPSAALSYNIARAYEKLSDDAQTLRWYRNYLRLSPEAANRAEVQGYVQALGEALAKKGIQQLTVLSKPAGATVSIDGQPLGVTPLTVELPPGKHSASLSLRGFADAGRDFALPAASPLDVSVDLSPAPPSSGAAGRATPAVRERRFGIVPYVTLGVAAASFAGAAIFELSRRSAQNAAKGERVQTTLQQDLDDVNSRRDTARVLLGVGTVLAVTGGVLLAFNHPSSPESQAVVASVPGGATLNWKRNF